MLRLLNGRELPPIAWLVMAMFGFGLAMSIFITVSTNFLVEELKIRPSELGLLETIREIPGLLTIVMGAAVMTVAEPVVGAVALLLLCIGYINFFHVGTIEVLIVFSLISSVGFHLWWPVANTIALRLSTVETQGRRLGQLRSLMAGAQLTGIGIVLVAVTVFATGIRPLFVLAGGVAALGALAVWQLRSVGRIGHPPRVVLRRRYWLYYALTFLDGGRRHIFMTFAIFLLVDNYGVSVRTITILALINSAVSIGGAYVVGRLIDRVGERPILVIAFGALAFIFLGYAVIPWLGVLFVLYILDHLFFSAEVGITTYLRRILVKPDDLRPSLVAGQTMNHVAAVALPVTGGILWEAFGHQVPFIGGAVLAVMALILSTLVRRGSDVPFAGKAAAAPGRRPREAPAAGASSQGTGA